MTTGPDFGDTFARITLTMNKVADAMQRANHQMNKSLRPIARMYWTQGDRHIERVVQEILAGKPGRPAHIRLEAAALLGEVLDRADSTIR